MKSKSEIDLKQKKMPLKVFGFVFAFFFFFLHEDCAVWRIKKNALISETFGAGQGMGKIRPALTCVCDLFGPRGPTHRRAPHLA